ncbi:MAG TPA: 5'-nucleotidase C-terminal domain-containing protein, partial [Anaerolineales bacterium]|nr:5'-nucleotidase C-terminal domain-containing protein [Anaerolineales bacterium]
MKRKFATILVLITILAVAFPTFGTRSAAASEDRVDFWLTVLHNNDAESQLINLGAGLEDFGGAARFKTLVDELKFEATHGLRPGDQFGAKRGVIMVSSGDNFLAGPEFNASLEKGVPFYDTIAMDLIGYDAVAMGNHDFDFGPDVLADFISGYTQTHPAYVSSNLDFSGEPRLEALVEDGRIAKSIVVKARGDLIGVIGATTPSLPFISSPRNVEVDPGVAGAVQAEVDKMEMIGINKIILISHLQSVQEDLALAPMLEGIDVMVAGGGDEVLANPGDLLIPGDEIFGPYPLTATGGDGAEIPVVTTRGSYSYVGRLVVGFDKGGNVIELGTDSGPVRVAGGDNPDAVEPDPVVQARVVEPVEAAIAALAENVIGTSEVDLNGVRADVRTKETNEGNLIADALKWQADQLAPSFGAGAPDIALQNGGGIRNDSIIPAGPITALDTFTMVPFPNFVAVVESIPPEQLKEIMENAVSRVEFVDGRFAQISGFTLVWNPSGTPQVLDLDANVTTPGTRVVEITLDDGTSIVSGGSVVPGAPSVNVATIDFLANGGDQY